MAERTHTDASGERVSALRREAAGSAPTAPHATAPAERRGPTAGPERFWRSRRASLVFAACLVVSAALHYAAAPWSLLPRHAFEIHDVDGTLTIPVDLIQDTPPPSPEPPPPPIPERVEPRPGGDTSRADAGPPPRARDAGDDAPVRLSDAAALDAPPDVAPADAGEAGARLDDAGAAQADASAAPAGNPRDAVGMIGAAGSVQAGVQNVVLLVNMARIRRHPEGKRLGPLISAVPQWDDFIQGTHVDPLADIDWVSINGPALLHTEKDVILVRYAAPDAVVDQAIVALGKKHGRGGPVDVGVPGVKALNGYADRAPRVFLRPQPHVLAVVPADYAKTAARILSKASVPAVLKRPDEALRLTLVHPHGPMPGVPESVTELRLWIVPRDADGGADVYVEGDTPSAAAASGAVAVLAKLIDDQNSFAVRLVTHGLLSGVELRPDGSRVELHVSASRDQIEVVLAFVAGQLGVPFTPEPAGSTTNAAPR